MKEFRGILWFCLQYATLVCDPEKGKSIHCFQMEVYAKGYPVKIWVIIDAPHPAYLNKWLSGDLVVHYKWVVHYKRSCGRWCPCVWSSYPLMAHQGVMFLPIPKSAVPNDDIKLGVMSKIWPHSCFASHFDVILCSWGLLAFLSSHHQSSSSTLFSQE